MPMKDDLRQAKDAVLSLYVRGDKEEYIDRCDLSPEDVEILKRIWVKGQSRVAVAREMNMDEKTVYRHYRKSMLVLACVIAQTK